jgi:hypothetical protein
LRSPRQNPAKALTNGLSTSLKKRPMLYESRNNLTAGQRYGACKIVTTVEVAGFPPIAVVIPFSFKLPHLMQAIIGIHPKWNGCLISMFLQS